MAQPIVLSCEERRDFWVMLRAIAGVSTEVLPSREEIAAEVRQEMVGRIASGIMHLADEPGGVAAALTEVTIPTPTPGAQQPAAGHGAPDGSYMAPWIDSEECTTCDECIKINRT